jgi:hypothetical protein
MTTTQSPGRLSRPYVVASTLTLGLAVLAMIVFVLRDGQPVPLPQIVNFAVLSATGIALVTRFVRAIPGRSGPARAHGDADAPT